MEGKYVQEIASRLNLRLPQVNSIARLQEEGATIPFIARYRKEATGNADEVVIADVSELIKYFSALEKRKETMLKTIGELGKLSPELSKRIEDCFDAGVLEDIYLPFKPKRKTRATQAIDKGLLPLADLLWKQEAGDPESMAAPYTGENVKDSKEALQGARDIIAERISEHEQSRQVIRKLFGDSAVLTSKILSSKKEDEGAQKYRDYFEFSGSLADSPSHRTLAIRRGEKEGFLIMDINIGKEEALEALETIHLSGTGATSGEVKKAIEDGFTRLLKPAIESEFRVMAKNKADEEAIRVFSENLRQLLLASPLGNKRILALDPGFRTGCKLVCLDEQGNLLHNTTIFTLSEQQTTTAVSQLQQLVRQYRIEAIGIGNGTAGRETEQLVRSIDFGTPVSIFQVNESGASIYSASEVAREEFPEQDVTVRGAISIGRRLLDPLSELVKIDAKSIGVGQYQHDVNQVKLKEGLDRVVESAVNFVGVDLNTASRHLLLYVSGLSETVARNIVDYRTKHGAFSSREELKKVALMGPKTFEQCAGFLRIPGATNVLDNSSVHPESYHLVEAMAADLGTRVETLVTEPAVRRKINPQQYVSEAAGTYTISDILKELEKPGRDPRPPIEVFQFDDSIKTMEDLKPGMTIPGLVTNITNFGAFVDIGVKQDGLVHISQLSNTFVADPAQVVKLQQRVMVTVTEVDIPRKRIALSMKTTGEKAAPPQKPVPGKKPAAGKPEALNPFQAKLAELKKKLS